MHTLGCHTLAPFNCRVVSIIFDACLYLESCSRVPAEVLRNGNNNMIFLLECGNWLFQQYCFVHSSDAIS